MGCRLRTSSVIEVCGAPISKAHTFAEEARSDTAGCDSAHRVIVDPFGFDSHLLRCAHGLVRIERWISNPNVEGSNPSGRVPFPVNGVACNRCLALEGPRRSTQRALACGNEIMACNSHQRMKGISSGRGSLRVDHVKKDTRILMCALSY